MQLTSGLISYKGRLSTEHYPTNKIIVNMELTLNLNSRLQPMHRHDLEDALQEILEKINLG